MKKTFFFMAIAVAIAVVFIKCDDSKKPDLSSEAWTGYEPFPKGYGYMDTAALQLAYKQVNIAAIREHAWSLFAGIMQPAAKTPTWPIWYTWPNTTDAFAPANNGKLGATEGGATTSSLITKNLKNVVASGIIKDSVPLPYYPINKAVIQQYPKSCNAQANTIASGKHFMNNGDIMVPTESLSMEGYDWIRKNNLYQQTKLNELFNNKTSNLNAPSTYIVTKHMFWPVLAPSKQQYSAIPVWDESVFKDSTSNNYRGYETWSRLVAVDPTNAQQKNKPVIAAASFLYGVFEADSVTPMKTVTKRGIVHNINEFYYHQVTQADWNSFDENDKAILNASSYWAYNKPFGVGDYIVTIAMHINTKELPSWALQSVWWSDIPNTSKYAANRPNLSSVTKDTTWRNYLLVDAYGIPTLSNNMLPIATNPYIELVIHPIATNCNNCHIRSGWPAASSTNPNYASYQNPLCKSLLEKLSENSPCFKSYMRTDFQWIIPDHAQ